jgi:hypothetical protein
MILLYVNTTGSTALNNIPIEKDDSVSMKDCTPFKTIL